MTKFYFLLCLMTSQHCKLTSVIPVMHHLQSNMFVGLKMQGISRLAYLCIFCHMAFFPPPGGKASTKHLAKTLYVITNKILTCCKAKASMELQPFTPVARLGHPKS